MLKQLCAIMINGVIIRHQLIARARARAQFGVISMVLVSKYVVAKRSRKHTPPAISLMI